MNMMRPDRRREAIFKSLRFVSDNDYIGGEKRLRNVPHTVRVCEDTRFLDWCHEKDMDILVTWADHFQRKGIPHVAAKTFMGASIWKPDMTLDAA